MQLLLPKQITRALLFVLPAVMGLMGLAGCGQNPEKQIPAAGSIPGSWLETETTPGDWSFLLITLDTTRRDHLSCYGYSAPTTPVIDSLAAAGVLFENAIAPVPVTLPSHSTMMTGLNPNEHGVRNNGFVLGSDRECLAEVLGRSGYVTGATCGAFPVDHQFGLAQGFDSYDDQFSTESRTRDWQWLQRTADEVTRITADWMAARDDRPFFHWAHYFDPHAPYDPPEPFANRFADPYEGEIAYMDAEIGRLIQSMDELGLLEQTWILIVGDHGESLGEHGEETHGVYIYGATLDVPLILVPPRAFTGPAAESFRGRRIADVVGLRDIAPTMLNCLGFPAGRLPASGVSLMPTIVDSRPGPPVVYCESLIPSLDYGWSELYGVKNERWSYIRAPQRELYDLSVDPSEQNNVIGDHPAVAGRLDDWCDYFIRQGGDERSTQAPDPETIERLRSLGYVAGSSAVASHDTDKNPKDYAHVLGKISRARKAFGNQQLAVAERLYEEALQDDPQNPATRRELASTLLRAGNAEDALPLYESLLEDTPGDHEISLNLARTLIMMDSLSAARALVEFLYQETPTDQEMINLHTELLFQQGREQEARSILLQISAQRPDDAAALTQLANLEFSRDNYADALEMAGRALAIDSTQADALGIKAELVWNDAQRAIERNREADADALLRVAEQYLAKALEQDPTTPRAAFRAAYLAAQRRQFAMAVELYQRALSRRPEWADAHFNLGNVLRAMNRPTDALQHYDSALRLGLDVVDLHVNRGVALAMLQRFDQAAAAWRSALERNPDPATAAGIRKNLERLGR